jgi:hypothetical protein
VGVPCAGVEVGWGAAAVLEGVVAVLDPGSERSCSFGSLKFAVDPGEQVEEPGEVAESAVVAGAAVGVVGVGERLKVDGGVGEVAGGGSQGVASVVVVGIVPAC